MLQRYLVVYSFWATLIVTSAAAGEKGVVVHKGEGQLEVSIDKKPFFTYQHDTQKPEQRRPIIHPLHGPTGAVITQMGEVPGKRTAPRRSSAVKLGRRNATPLRPIRATARIHANVAT